MYQFPGTVAASGWSVPRVGGQKVFFQMTLSNHTFRMVLTGLLISTLGGCGSSDPQAEGPEAEGAAEVAPEGNEANAEDNAEGTRAAEPTAVVAPTEPAAVAQPSPEAAQPTEAPNAVPVANPSQPEGTRQ